MCDAARMSETPTRTTTSSAEARVAAHITRRRLNALSQTHPAIAAYWHPTKNGSLTPHDVTAKSKEPAWWTWPDGHEDQISIAHVSQLELHGKPWPCTICRYAHIRYTSYPPNTPVAEIPELVAAWIDDTPYGGMTLAEADLWYYNLQCPQGHKPKLHPSTFLGGCPHCRAVASKPTSPTVASAHPEMASQWHPTLNKLRPEHATERSKRKVWWLADCCGYEWEMSPRDRYRPPGPEEAAPGGRLAYRCPQCQTILGSLAFTDPDLAASWHPNNSLTASQVRPHSQRVMRWMCTADPEHVWDMSVAARSAGTACPFCSTAGTSLPEKALTAALCALGLDASPGTVERTIPGAAWRVDARATVSNRRLVVEFDGSYWHRNKVMTDEIKTHDLLASGHHVARVRCRPLPFLGIDHPHLLQLDFVEGGDDVTVTAAAIWAWINTAEPK